MQLNTVHGLVQCGIHSVASSSLNHVENPFSKASQHE